MVYEYRIQIQKDDGSYINFGNSLSSGSVWGLTVPFTVPSTLSSIGGLTILKKAFDLVHTKKNKISIFNFKLDNGTGLYDNEFTEGNDVQFFVKIDGTNESKRFGGEIIEVSPDSDNKNLTITCTGRNSILIDRYWTGVATNIDFGQHIKNVLIEKVPEVDVSGINVSTGYIIDEVKAESQRLDEHFEDLQRETTWILDINPNNVAIIFDSNKGSSGITLADGIGGNVKRGSNKLRESRLSIKNSITVIGGSETTTDFDEDQITWNTGDSTLITLSNVVDEIVWVKFNGIIKTEGVDWELTSDKRFVKLLTITNGQTVDIRNNFKTGVWWKEQDPLATKLKEFVIKDPTILTQDRAESLAKNTLAKLLVIQVKGAIESALITNEFEWYETLELLTGRFNGEHIIVGFTETITEDYEVSFELAQVLDENAKKIIELSKELDKLKKVDTDDILKDGLIFQDILDILENLTGFEIPIGTRAFWDISDWDDGTTYDTGEGTETQFL